MKVALFVAGLCLASATASVVPVKGERKVADATFLNRQKMVLDLFVGLGHDDHFQNENANFDIMANAEHFSDPSVAKKFMETYQRGMLPKDHIFTLSCPHVRHQAIRLFDLFYFAKDFDTFYKSASWSKKYVNPMMFSYAFTLALVHRDDTRGFSFPPLYEMYPNYFVPEDIMHKFYDYKMSGIKHGKFEYNNTGYEYNYHDEMFGGPLSQDVYNPHSEYKISYFREDVGLNSLYAYAFKYPEWMCPKKYNLKGYFRRGELGYAFHQQLLARYTLERLANALPYAEPLYFDRPVRVGYTPRIAHFNGESFIARPDGFNFDDALNKKFVYMAKHYEQRLFDAVDYGSYWNQSSDSMVDLMNEDGIDKLGQLAFGSISHHDPVGRYYGSYYYAFIDALANMVKTTNTKNFNGGVASMKMTTLRDPAFYNMLVRFVGLFQRHKSHLPVYMKKDLKFPGVSVTNIEFDKLVTYFDMFDYEITNGVGATDPKEYIDLRYQTSQFRLNHKPYNFKISVNSDAAYDGMVRLFIGPKFDAEERVMSLEQKRLAMFEIDRFPVKIAAGANVFERNSKESPIFAPDQEGFRTMYEKIDHALKTNEPYYINERITCGVPERLQLPKGWKSGQQYTFAVVVTPYENKPGHENQILCGSNKLYDGRPYGFPFDRPIWSNEFNIPNIYFKDEFIYHKEDAEVNRSSA